MTPKGAWPPGSDQSPQTHSTRYHRYLHGGWRLSVEQKASRGILHLYLMGDGRIRQEHDHSVSFNDRSMDRTSQHACAHRYCDVYLLCDVAFVMYGCQVTQDQFSSLGLSWAAFSAVITKAVNVNPSHSSWRTKRIVHTVYTLTTIHTWSQYTGPFWHPSWWYKRDQQWQKDGCNTTKHFFNEQKHICILIGCVSVSVSVCVCERCEVVVKSITKLSLGNQPTAV